jgi:hypothetical protein
MDNTWAPSSNQSNQNHTQQMVQTIIVINTQKLAWLWTWIKFILTII